jgi:hypothetical protein
MHVERRLTSESVHKLALPEKVRAWWFLRRRPNKRPMATCADAVGRGWIDP